MRTRKIIEAAYERYKKIGRQIYLATDKNDFVLDSVIGDAFDQPFPVGKRIIVDGTNIMIKDKSYAYFELQKVTINEEGSMSVYDRSSRRLCGWAELNMSTPNVELFLLWVRKYNIPVEIISGKRERVFQWCILVVAILVIVVVEVLKYLSVH